LSEDEELREAPARTTTLNPEPDEPGRCSNKKSILRKLQLSKLNISANVPLAFRIRKIRVTKSDGVKN
jgi:hypothetical protein